ncbi:hypothetical protein ACFL5V_00935 [Fibrobacterota bacterium]
MQFFSIQLILLSIILGLAGCKQKEEHRHYREINISETKKVSPHSLESSADQSFSSPVFAGDMPDLRIKWDVPQGWSEKPGRGMRLAVFDVKSGTLSAQCVVVQLPDSGGGLVSNVKRWMQQLKLVILSEESLQDFLSRQQRYKTMGGFNAIMIDMTDLLSGDITSDLSGLMAVIPVKGQTLYITLFGARRLLLENKRKFLSLIRSLRIAG